MEPADSVLEEIRQLEPGHRTNRVLFDFLLRPRFLGYWTFFEPEHRGVELSDVVFVWGDTAILFEAKTRGVPRPADIGWLRDKIGQAVDQLNRRVQLLTTGTVVLRNEWRGELRLDPTMIQHYYGVIVLTAEFEPFEWRDLADEEFQRATIPVQVFSLFDLAELLRFVDTPWDFVVYFELRARYGREHQMLVGRELDTFQEVLGMMDRLQDGTEEEGRRQQHYWLGRANAILRTQLATDEGFELWAASRLIDFAYVPSEAMAEVDSSGRPVASEGNEIFVRSLEALAEMSRNRRSEYGRRWVSAAQEAVAEGRLAFRSSHSPSRSRTYVFAAWPLGTAPREETLVALATREMEDDRTTSCVALGAPAASILETFRSLVLMCRGDESELPDDDFILSPLVVFIGPR